MASVFSDVPLAPPDPIFNLTASFKADTFKDKVNLGVGAYRDNDGKPWVLPSVKKAEHLLVDDDTQDHEYLPITGLAEFTQRARDLILGKDNAAVADGRVASVQTISGTGANHVGAVFLQKFFCQPSTAVYISNPTWANHKAIWKLAGVEQRDYPYFDAKTRGLDFEGMLAALQQAPEGSIVLLHACAHNPTGVDPTQEQWKEIARVMKARQHFPFFDAAYQGFASGDLDRDAWAIRHFISEGLALLVCQSFSKNFGLYGERAGCFHFVAPTKESCESVRSQLAVLLRSEISNPPAFGARLVTTVLRDPALYGEWVSELQLMSQRIKDMRKELYDRLTALGTPGTWDHIVDQIGMFSFTGLTKPQCDKLISEYHIYLTGNGRISMAGLNTHNIDYFARAMDAVVRSA